MVVMQPQRPSAEFHIFATLPDDLNTQHNAVCEVNHKTSSSRWSLYLQQAAQTKNKDTEACSEIRCQRELCQSAV